MGWGSGTSHAGVFEVPFSHTRGLVTLEYEEAEPSGKSWSSVTQSPAVAALGGVRAPEQADQPGGMEITHLELRGGKRSGSAPRTAPFLYDLRKF